MRLWQLLLMGDGASSPPSYTFIGAYPATVSGTDLVKTGVVVPAAGLLLIIASGRAASGFQVTGVNVGSDAATEVIRTPGGYRNPSAIYSRVMTAGATVDVTAFTGGAVVGSLSFILLTGLSSNTAIDTDHSESGSDQTSSALGLTLTADAIGIWVSNHREPEGVTWTNATELYDISGGSNHEESGALYQDASPSTRTVTAAWATADQWSMVAAAWR